MTEGQGRDVWSRLSIFSSSRPLSPCRVTLKWRSLPCDPKAFSLPWICCLMRYLQRQSHTAKGDLLVANCLLKTTLCLAQLDLTLGPLLGITSGKRGVSRARWGSDRRGRRVRSNRSTRSTPRILAPPAEATETTMSMRDTKTKKPSKMFQLLRR